MTKTYLCGQCYLQGQCRRLTSRIVNDDELTPKFIADIRSMMRSLDITRDRWPLFLIEAYRDYPGRIVAANSDEVQLDTSVYDLPSIRYWFRDMCREIPEGIMPRLRREARPRLIVTATILRATYPVAAIVWGKGIANDVEPGIKASPSSSPDACPYESFVINGSGNKNPAIVPDLSRHSDRN